MCMLNVIIIIIIIFVSLQYWENGYPRLNLHKFQIWFSFLLLFRLARGVLAHIRWPDAMEQNRIFIFRIWALCMHQFWRLLYLTNLTRFPPMYMAVDIFPISTDGHWTVILFLFHFGAVTFTFGVFCLALADGFIIIIMISTNICTPPLSVVLAEQTREHNITNRREKKPPVACRHGSKWVFMSCEIVRINKIESIPKSGALNQLVLLYEELCQASMASSRCKPILRLR